MTDEFSILATNDLVISNSTAALFPAWSYEFIAGSITAVIGENGVGKSTLLDHLAGIKAPKSGAVSVCGINILNYSAIERCRIISSIGQSDQSTAGILVAQRIAQGLSPRLGLAMKYSERVNELVLEAAAATQVLHLLQRTLGTLSGGERKRVNLARALVDTEALIYILDEPFAGLDLRHQHTISLTLRNLSREGKVVILSLHDLILMSELPDYVIALAPHEVIATGAREQIVNANTLLKVFGIDYTPRSSPHSSFRAVL